MPSARHKEFVGSLRFRLSAWNTAVVVITILVTMVAVREGLRYTLIREADQLLREDLMELTLAIQEFYPDLDQIHEEMNRKAKGHEHRQLFVQVLDPAGNDVWSSINTPSVMTAQATFTAEHAPRTVDIYRIAQQQLESSDLPPYTIRVGISLAYVYEDTTKLAQLMFVVGAGLLVAAPLAGYWLAGRATQPLREIIHTAAGLQPARLEERLPLRHTGDELDQLSATINGLLDRIAAYLKRHREFTANAAHELRSPLAAIRSAAEVALNSQRSPAEYEELLCDVVEQIAQLSLLVNQLLLLAETDAAEMKLRRDPVRLDHLVARAVEMFRGVAEERGIELRNGELPAMTIRGDAVRLREVANNLIDNSLKFTPSGGTVDVRLSMDEAAQNACLEIRDTGFGIAPEDLPHIFERFYRADRSRNRDGSSRGNGLGLSICQAIVMAHEGRIEVWSAPNEGSRFSVYLPADPGPATSGSG
jgi:heavy metal sensor kinase